MSPTPESAGPSRKYGKALRWSGTVLAGGLVIFVCLMRWGGRVLEASDALPPHADAAIVLEGSLLGERARLEGAMQLLRQGIPARVLLPLPPTSYWGDPVPPMARHFLEANYGHDLAAQVDFCSVGAEVDSTLQEAQTIGKCIQEHHWRSVVVVTSNYHTRRASLLWRRVMGKENPGLQVSVYGVADKDFQADGWWRKRLWAKTWLLEFTKLIWAETLGR